MRLAGKSAVLLASAVCLVAASPASAKVARVASFTVRGTHGYRIRFEAYGRGSNILTGKTKAMKERGIRRAAGGAKHDRNVIQVEVDKARHPTFVAYLDTSKDRHFTPNSFSGSFGKRGSVDVRLRTRDRRTIHFPGCRGGILERSGFFTGTISFHGEHGYTSVEARRARGRVTSARHPQHCHFAPRPSKPPRDAELHAHKKARNGRFRTDLFAYGSKQLPDFGFGLAARSERRRGYTSVRGTLLITPSQILTYRPDLSRARLHAPAHSRLMGTARFVAPHHWTGPLSMALPGRDHIRLTGPRFHVWLRHPHND